MKRIIILAMVVVVGLCEVTASDAVTVEESLSDDGYRAVEVVGGLPYENVGGKRLRLQDKLRSQAEVLKLPFAMVDKIYTTPAEVKGVVEDIPFNYFAELEQSAEYVYSLLKDGFKVTSYSATSQVIFMELENSDDVVCRVVIYENYLKVYMPRREGF